MEYAEFRRHLGKAGLTVNAFAAYLGVKPSSVSNYARQKEVPRSYALLAVLLGDAADRGVDFSSVLRRFDMFPVAQSSNVHSLPTRKLERNKRGAGA